MSTIFCRLASLHVNPPEHTTSLFSLLPSFSTTESGSKIQTHTVEYSPFSIQIGSREACIHIKQSNFCDKYPLSKYAPPPPTLIIILSYLKQYLHKTLRVSDVNSPVFLHFWFCYIKSQFFFSIFCFNKYGLSLHYPNLKKKLTHLDIGSLRKVLLFHTKISIIYENGSKFAVV